MRNCCFSKAISASAPDDWARACDVPKAVIKLTAAALMSLVCDITSPLLLSLKMMPAIADKLRISAVSPNLSVEITSEARCAPQQLNDENFDGIARARMCCSDVTHFT
jgi:hypothetical protein